MDVHLQNSVIGFDTHLCTHIYMCIYIYIHILFPVFQLSINRESGFVRSSRMACENFYYNKAGDEHRFMCSLSLKQLKSQCPFKILLVSLFHREPSRCEIRNNLGSQVSSAFHDLTLLVARYPFVRQHRNLKYPTSIDMFPHLIVLYQTAILDCQRECTCKRIITYLHAIQQLTYHFKNHDHFLCHSNMLAWYFNNWQTHCHQNHFLRRRSHDIPLPPWFIVRSVSERWRQVSLLPWVSPLSPPSAQVPKRQWDRCCLLLETTVFQCISTGMAGYGCYEIEQCVITPLMSREHSAQFMNQSFGATK